MTPPLCRRCGISAPKPHTSASACIRALRSALEDERNARAALRTGGGEGARDSEPAIIRWCPRCHAEQNATPDGYCAGCGGLTSLFPPPPRPTREACATCLGRGYHECGDNTCGAEGVDCPDCVGTGRRAPEGT